MNKNLIGAFFIPLFFLFIIFPVIALWINLDWNGIVSTFNDWYFWDSVKNTIIAAGLAGILSLIVAVGTGFYYLFHRNSLTYKITNLFNDLPIALPHTVAGLALLLAYGRKNLSFIGQTGLAFSFFSLVLAMFFVSYSLASRTLISGIDQIEKEVVEVARTLGDNSAQAYFRVVLPTLGEALVNGFILSFSRSVSEFAAVIMFGGNLPGKTQVLASYVFTKVEVGELKQAVTASVFCVLLSLTVLSLTSVRRLGHAKSE